ncbi:MAG: hypothetical protein LBK58_01515 [Prevotellaceae bacterium]|jgi:hypothetical protein|nr:hypothetical protein [Prevotellaceae bacterium]
MRKIKFFVLLTALLCSANAVWSQDVIVLKNTEEIKALVQEVGLTDVKYKKYENASGPTYTLLKSDIFMIKYANGEKDVFKDEPVAPAVTPNVPSVSTPETPRKGLTDAYVAPAADVSASGALKVEHAFFGVTVSNDQGRKLNNAETLSLLGDIPDALSLYQKGKRGVIIGDVCVIVGGFMLGWELGDLKNSNSATMTLSAGTFVFGIVYYYTSFSKIKKSLTIYNNTMAGRPNTYSLNFGLTPSGGIGLTLNF